MNSSRISHVIKSNIFRYSIRISSIRMGMNQILFVPSRESTQSRRRRQSHCMNSIVTNSGSFIANVSIIMCKESFPFPRDETDYHLWTHPSLSGNNLQSLCLTRRTILRTHLWICEYSSILIKMTKRPSINYGVNLACFRKKELSLNVFV